MNSLSIDWDAVSALAACVQTLLLAVSLWTLRGQLERLQQEKTSDLVAGLQTALGLMGESSKLKRLIDNAVHQHAFPQDEEGWEESLIVLDQVALLVDRGYTDFKLLMTLKSAELAALAEHIRSASAAGKIPVGSQLFTSTRFERVQLLLDRSVKWVADDQAQRAHQSASLWTRLTRGAN